jgi:hypothetical protein
MGDILKRLDGYKNYLIGCCMILASISIWVLNLVGVDQPDIPSNDVATALFWVGLGWLGWRDVNKKVLRSNRETADAVERLIRLVDTNGPPHRQD